MNIELSMRRRILIITMAFAIAFALSASLFHPVKAQSFQGDCINSSHLREFAEFEVNGVPYNITFAQTYCPLGCVSNGTYGDVCKTTELQETNSPMAIAGLIGVAVLMFAMFYLAISIGSQHGVMQILLLSIGLFLGEALIWFSRILMFNAGQTTIATLLDTIFIGYLGVVMLAIAYFPTKWYLDRLKIKRQEKEDGKD